VNSGITTPAWPAARAGGTPNFISKAGRIRMDQCTVEREQILLSSLTERADMYRRRPGLLITMATGRGKPHTLTETRYSAMINASYFLYQIPSVPRTFTNSQTKDHIIKFSNLYTKFPYVCKDRNDVLRTVLQNICS
jgi:hypothetical protein